MYSVGGRPGPGLRNTGLDESCLKVKLSSTVHAIVYIYFNILINIYLVK